MTSSFGRPGARRRRAARADARASERTQPDAASSRAKAQPELTREKLEQAALAYLNRFDCTAKKLGNYLRSRARKLGGHSDAEAWIGELVERYLRSGVLNDARFAQHLASQLAARGKSARAISQRLAARGVPGDLTTELLATRRLAAPDAELEAARAYVRKRRLGPHRAEAERAEYYRKDLAALARQGFGFDVAARALGPGPGNDDEF